MFVLRIQNCTLCPVRCGPLKKLKDGNWVHLLCNIFVSGINPCRPSTIDASYKMGKSVRKWNGIFKFEKLYINFFYCFLYRDHNCRRKKILL